MALRFAPSKRNCASKLGNNLVGANGVKQKGELPRPFAYCACREFGTRLLWNGCGWIGMSAA
jgi:hypothetical protein